MSAKKPISPDEVSKNIVAGIGLAYDLFNEMNNLFRALIDSLESSDIDLLLLKRRFHLPKPKRKSLMTPADDYIKTHMGFLAEIGVSMTEDDDSGDLDNDQDSDLDQKAISIAPDSQFLAVRALLYDAGKVKSGTFQPLVVGAVLSSIKRLPKKKTSTKDRAEGKFQLKKRAYLFRGMGLLDDSVKKGIEISWAIPKYKISATVSGVVKKPLVYFNSEKRLSTFASGLMSMC